MFTFNWRVGPVRLTSGFMTIHVVALTDVVRENHNAHWLFTCKKAIVTLDQDINSWIYLEARYTPSYGTHIPPHIEPLIQYMRVDSPIPMLVLPLRLANAIPTVSNPH